MLIYTSLKDYNSLERDMVNTSYILLWRVLCSFTCKTIFHTGCIIQRGKDQTHKHTRAHTYETGVPLKHINSQITTPQAYILYIYIHLFISFLGCKFRLVVSSIIEIHPCCSFNAQYYMERALSKPCRVIVKHKEDSSISRFNYSLEFNEDVITKQISIGRRE